MLITASDVTALGIELEDGDEQIVERLIESASSAITAAAGCPIVESTSTVRVLGLPERLLGLPGVPVTSVTAVYVDGELLPDTRYRVAAAGVYRPEGWQQTPLPPVVDITYVHGLKSVPADIVTLCASMVAAGLNAIRAGDFELQNGRISSTSIDDFREAYATSGEGIEQVTPMDLPARTRAALRARFGGSATVVSTL